MKYNQTIIDNIRATAKAAGVDTTQVSDERLHQIYEDCYFDDEPEKAMLEVLREEHL